VLEKLDNNESVLLMYLAEELPAEDRAEIERMLAGDDALRKQLASLRLAQETTESALRAVDAMPLMDGRAAMESGSAAEAAAIRRISRSMRSHLVRQLSYRPAEPAKRGLLFPWWAYPSAATAASVLAFFVWFANYTGNSPLNIPGPSHPTQMFGGGIASNDDPQITRFWQQREDARQDQVDATGRAQEQQLATIDAGEVWKVGSSDTP
jgi:hypothetical protein